MELKNNTVLITGGTSGFGLEFTKRFLELGNTVLITGRNPVKLAETKKLFPQVHTFQSDISKPDDIKSLYQQVIEQFPDLNMLINNAGEMRKLVLHDGHELVDITREIDINLMGPIRMVQQFLPHLKTQRAAAILNVTSGIALMAFPIAPVYGATKAGLRSYTQSLRVQLKHTPINVFELVAPGSATPLNDQFKEVDGFSSSGMMAPERIVAAALNAMQQDKWEVYPGLLRAIRFLIRLAPQFVLSQASKIGAAAMQGKQLVNRTA